MADARRNISYMVAYKFLSEFYLILPILIPYYKANGLADSQVFIIQAVYTGAFLIFEIPSGYLGDIIGRRMTLFFGAVLVPAGLAVYVLSQSFFGFLLAEIILAFASSMRSGTDIAMIWDSLEESRNTGDYSKIQGRTELFTRIGTGSSSLLGGAFGVIALRLPFYINIGTGLLMAVVALNLREPERKKPPAHNPWKEIIRIVRFCLGEPLIRKLMGFWAILMASGLIGIWSYFLYYRNFHLSLGFYGFLYAIFQLSGGMGAHSGTFLEKKMGRSRLLLFPLLLIPSFVFLGIWQSFWLIPLICLNGFLWNAVGPAVFNMVNSKTESSVRATVISTVNMAGSLTFVITGPLFGLVSDLFSLSAAYFFLAALILFIAAPLVFSLFHMLKFQEKH